MPGIYRLKGTVKHYDWGGQSFIPALLQMENKNNQPFAEYWMGTHPQDNCTAELPNHQRVLLKEYLKSNPEFLGEEVQRRFGHLPYLFKVLDVHKMLSIQVHPSKASAEKESGITIHLVNEHYDDGRILFQGRCAIDEHATPQQIAECVHRLEHEFYPKVIEKWITEKS